MKETTKNKYIPALITLAFFAGVIFAIVIPSTSASECYIAYPGTLQIAIITISAGSSYTINSNAAVEVKENGSQVDRYAGDTYTVDVNTELEIYSPDPNYSVTVCPSYIDIAGTPSPYPTSTPLADNCPPEFALSPGSSIECTLPPADVHLAKCTTATYAGMLYRWDNAQEWQNVQTADCGYGEWYTDRTPDEFKGKPLQIKIEHKNPSHGTQYGTLKTEAYNDIHVDILGMHYKEYTTKPSQRVYAHIRFTDSETDVYCRPPVTNSGNADTDIYVEDNLLKSGGCTRHAGGTVQNAYTKEIVVKKDGAGKKSFVLDIQPSFIDATPTSFLADSCILMDIPVSGRQLSGNRTSGFRDDSGNLEATGVESSNNWDIPQDTVSLWPYPDDIVNVVPVDGQPGVLEFCELIPDLRPTLTATPFQQCDDYGLQKTQTISVYVGTGQSILWDADGEPIEIFFDDWNGDPVSNVFSHRPNGIVWNYPSQVVEIKRPQPGDAYMMTLSVCGLPIKNTPTIAPTRTPKPTLTPTLTPTYPPMKATAIAGCESGESVDGMDCEIWEQQLTQVAQNKTAVSEYRTSEANIDNKQNTAIAQRNDMLTAMAAQRPTGGTGNVTVDVTAQVDVNVTSVTDVNVTVVLPEMTPNATPDYGYDQTAISQRETMITQNNATSVITGTRGIVTTTAYVPSFPTIGNNNTVIAVLCEKEPCHSLKASYDGVQTILEELDAHKNAPLCREIAFTSSTNNEYIVIDGQGVNDGFCLLIDETVDVRNSIRNVSILMFFFAFVMYIHWKVNRLGS